MKEPSKNAQNGVKTASAEAPGRFYAFGPFRLDAREHVLSKDGSPLSLTPRVFDLLHHLVRNPGRLLTKEELLAELWGEVVVEESNLSQNVFVLRKALGDTAEPHRWIETVPRRGYRFIGDVMRPAEEPAQPPARAPEPSSPGTEAPAPAPELEAAPPIAPPAAASVRTATRPWLRAGVPAGLLVLGAVALWRLRSGGSVEPPRFHRVGSSGRDESPSASPDGRTLAFASDRDGRSRIWLAESSGSAERPLTSGPDTRPRFSPDGASVLFVRDEEGHAGLYHVATLGGEPRRILADATDGDWSPDGRRIVFTRSGTEGGIDWSSLSVASADGGNPRELIRLTDNELDSPRWSPDGQFVVARKAGTSTGVLDSILVLQPDGTKKRFLTLPEPPGRISSLAWAGGGADVLYAESDSLVSTRAGASTRIVRHDVRSGESRVLFWVPEIVSGLDVLGRERLVFDARSSVESLREVPLGASAASAGESGWLAKSRSNDRQPAYSADGEWIAFSSDRSRNLDLWAVSPKTGQLRRITDDAADDWDPAFTRDGKKLVWSSNRSGAFEIWIADADGSGARQLTRDGLDAENPTPTGDGQWIVYGSANPAKSGVWKIHPDGSGASRLTAGTAIWPEVSPDGEYVSYRRAPYDFPNTSTGLVSLRVARVSDGSDTGFEIRVREGLSAGRSRWMPGGRAIAFVAPDDKGVNGIFVQDFAPGRDTSATRRPLAGFDPAFVAESFGLARDGSRIAIAARQQFSNLLVAERVPGVGRPLGK